jgi:hypothetical protein
MLTAYAVPIVAVVAGACITVRIGFMADSQWGWFHPLLDLSANLAALLLLLLGTEKGDAFKIKYATDEEFWTYGTGRLSPPLDVGDERISPLLVIRQLSCTKSLNSEKAPSPTECLPKSSI